MDYLSVIIGVVGGVASIIGAIVSCHQSKEADKAKDASVAAKEAIEAARDKIFQNIQLEDFTSFQKECEKFIRFLHLASKGKYKQGKNKQFIEDALESFITKFNNEISRSSGDDRDKLLKQYDILNSKRNTVNSDDRTAILLLLDDIRFISRTIADIQMKNKLNI